MAATDARADASTEERDARTEERDAERAYAQAIDERIRTATFASRLRAVGVQSLWIVVIIAGAGVPLSQAVGAEEWVGPLLGFVVVVAAGIERVFGRTSLAATAHDDLRRSLGREQRLFGARTGPYAEGARPFDTYVDRCEQIIERYDATMLAHGRELAGRGD